MRIDSEVTALTVVSGAVGVFVALTLSAPTALADPAQSEPGMPVAAPAVPGDPVPPVPGPAPGPAPAPTDAPVAAPAVAPAVTPAPGPATELAATAVAPAATPAAAPAPAPVDPAIPTTGPAPGPATDGTVQAIAGVQPTPPDGMPHLSSPENLPPGTTDTPPDGDQRTLGYLRDIWHAYQTQEVSGRDALLLLTQRPMSANPAPPPGMPANPTPPVPTEAAPPVAPEPAPPLVPAPAP